MQAILVRVTTDIEIAGERAVALWIVASGDPKRAEAIVREMVSSDSIVEATDKRVAPEVVERLRLLPGDAYHL